MCVLLVSPIMDLETGLKQEFGDLSINLTDEKVIVECEFLRVEVNVARARARVCVLCVVCVCVCVLCPSVCVCVCVRVC